MTYSGAMLFGVADAFYNTQIFSLLSTLFASRKESAFSFKNLVQSVLTSALLFVSLSIAFETLAAMVAGFAMTAIFSLNVLQWRVKKYGLEHQHEAKR